MSPLQIQIECSYKQDVHEFDDKCVLLIGGAAHGVLYLFVRKSEYAAEYVEDATGSASVVLALQEFVRDRERDRRRSGTGLGELALEVRGEERNALAPPLPCV